MLFLSISLNNETNNSGKRRPHQRDEGEDALKGTVLTHAAAAAPRAA